MSSPEEIDYYEAGRESYDEAVRVWTEAILGLNTELRSHIDKLDEEMGEVMTAQTDEDLIMELGDVINCAIQALHCLGRTLADVHPIITEKNKRNYPVDTMNALLANGYTRQDAIAYLRRQRTSPTVTSQTISST